MTISQQYTTDISYIGNGVQTQFPIPFPFFTPAADVRAMLVTGSGDARAETPLVYNRDFTVSASPGVGGSLTTVAPPAVGVTLLIYLAVAILQELDLHDQGRIPAERLERSLDKLTMICQQQQHASLERAVQVPIGAGDPQDLVTSLFAARSEAAASAAGAAQSQGEAANSAQAAAEQAEGAAASALAAQEAAAQVVTDISGAMAAIQAEGDAQVARVDAEGEVRRAGPRRRRTGRRRRRITFLPCFRGLTPTLWARLWHWCRKRTALSYGRRWGAGCRLAWKRGARALLRPPAGWTRAATTANCRERPTRICGRSPWPPATCWMTRAGRRRRRRKALAGRSRRVTAFPPSAFRCSGGCSHGLGMWTADWMWGCGRGIRYAILQAQRLAGLARCQLEHLRSRLVVLGFMMLWELDRPRLSRTYLIPH